MTHWEQLVFQLPSYPRGYHLITHLIDEAMGEKPFLRVGLVHIFLMHTSASLTLNENADPTVRGDFARHMDVLCPENAPYFQHTFEGADDMPAHLKTSLLGSSLTLPLREGQLFLGTWQGVYLCEHRNRGGSRTLALTMHGELEKVL